MENLTIFSPEVCEELKYYVYRLVDPRNGQTFYVGKGKDNRIFEHVKCAINDDSDENLKYKKIKEIKDSGLEIIHIIQKYGLNERDAFVIESVLIDVYSIDIELTNKIKGFNSTEPQNAITLQRDLALSEFTDSPENPKYMIIKIQDRFLMQREDRYDCTRRAWKINMNNAKKYPYVLSVSNGIVREVYEVEKWQPSQERDGRYEFIGKVAEKKIRDLFIDKKIPKGYRTKGQSNPVLYCKNR